MIESEYNFTWDEVFKMVNRRKYIDINYLELKFYVITYENKYLHDYIDWIEKESFYDSNNIIDNVFSEYSRFTRGRGKTRTAELLWTYKSDKEKIALVLLMMYVWQVIKNYPENWSVNVENIFKELREVLFLRMEELNMQLWNNNVKKPMPFSLLLENHICSLFNPKNLEDILDIFTLEVNYIFNKYQLVKCTDPTYEERRKEMFEKLSKTNMFK